MELDVNIRSPMPIDADAVSAERVKIDCITNTIMVDQYGTQGVYNGQHVFEPGQNPIEIKIKNLVSKNDILINPIPSNYGLITYDGSTLTVS